MNSPSAGRHLAAQGRARGGRTARSLGAGLLAAALVVLLTPFGVGIAAASQQGEDHKVTLCHRTNSENNPYVTITVDKAAVFKRGHDTHDEGGVYQPGDKAAGNRWGDIIPAFDYYATPKDTATTRYPGLNNTAEGLAILANGCQVPDESEDVEPTGTLTGECTDSAHFVVTGAFDTDGATDVQFRLAIDGESPIMLTESPFEERITSPVGTVVTLEYRIGDGAWTSTGETVTVLECAPQGSFTTTCTATGAEVDLDRLRRGTFNGGHFELVVNGTAQTVVSQQQDIAVPGGATLVLQYVTSDDEVIVLDEGTAPAACPDVTPVAPTGSFTTACTATGALADVGTLTTGTATGGTFHLVATGFDQAVTSGQQDVTVPASAAVRLEYRVSGGATVLDTEQTPAACPAVAPVRGLGVVKAVTPAGPATFGATLTYSLTVSTTGNAAQTAVTVTDTVPAGTTYVAGSAACDAGTCSVTVADGLVTWGLGTMAAGTSRTVTFAVTIDTPPAAADGSIPAVEIVNAGAVQSAEVGVTPSNEVRTPVAAVQGVKVGSDDGGEAPTSGGDAAPTSGGDEPDTVVAGVKSGPAVLAATGTGLSLPGALGISALLLVTGMLLLRIGAVRR